MEPNMAGVITE